MDLQSAMAGLKKTTTSDRSGPDPLEALRQQKQEAETFSKMCEVNMEKWYPVLKEHTFASEWIPVTQELARAFIKAFEKYKANGKELFDFLEDPEIAAFHDSIDKLIKNWTVALKKSKEYLERRLKEIENETSDPRVAQNLKQIALFTAKLKGLRVVNGLEAVQLLATSERIYDDLTAALKNDAEGHHKFDLNWIAREWMEIPTHMEFRAFVANGEMTAFLQDWDHLYFQEFEGGVFEKLSLQCKQFFEEHIRDLLREKLNLTQYVIDFAFVNERIYVIELNPFGEGTGAAPFDWHNPEHRQIIFHGPFTIKKVDTLPEITTTTQDSIMEMLEVAFRK